MALFLGHKMLKLYLKMCWYCCCSDTDTSQMHRYIKVLSTLFWRNKSNSANSLLRRNKAKLGFILIQHFSSNQTLFLKQKFAHLNTQFLVNLEKSWHFREVHLGQMFSNCNTKTTSLTGIPVAYKKIELWIHHIQPFCLHHWSPNPASWVPAEEIVAAQKMPLGTGLESSER